LIMNTTRIAPATKGAKTPHLSSGRSRKVPLD
jgi:hypothetical protein